MRSGVAHPESVADHSFRMALLAFALQPHDSPDRQRCGWGKLGQPLLPQPSMTPTAFPAAPLSCISMALVHDLAESLVGDITPDSGVSKADKHSREAVRAVGRAGRQSSATLFLMTPVAQRPSGRHGHHSSHACRCQPQRW